MDALVEERGRVVTRGSVGGGRGTESIIVWASVKAFCRYNMISDSAVGTEEKGVGLRERRAL